MYHQKSSYTVVKNVDKSHVFIEFPKLTCSVRTHIRAIEKRAHLSHLRKAEIIFDVRREIDHVAVVV